MWTPAARGTAGVARDPAIVPGRSSVRQEWSGSTTCAWFFHRQELIADTPSWRNRSRPRARRLLLADHQRWFAPASAYQERDTRQRASSAGAKWAFRRHERPIGQLVDRFRRQRLDRRCIIGPTPGRQPLATLLAWPADRARSMSPPTRQPEKAWRASSIASAPSRRPEAMGAISVAEALCAGPGPI